MNFFVDVAGTATKPLTTNDIQLLITQASPSSPGNLQVTQILKLTSKSKFFLKNSNSMLLGLIQCCCGWILLPA